MHMKQIYQSLVVASFFLVIHSTAVAEPVLSNKLPKELVRQIMSEGLWEDKFDNPQSTEARDLLWFLQEISSVQQNIPAIIDQLFGTHAGEITNNAVRLPRLYPVKIVILRNLKNAQINQAWMNRYLQMVFATIDIANIHELKQMAEIFLSKLTNKKIIIRDLSPEERNRIQKEIPKSHDVDITARDTKTNKYRISGLYNQDNSYFALDFARPIEDTLVTFVHEMIHASDPQLELYREQYKKLFDPTMQILAKWLQDKQGPNTELAFDLIDHLFFEMGLQHFKEAAEFLRKKRMSQLRQSTSDPSQNVAIFEPKPEDLKIVRAWISAAVGLTIENEYRAYGYSILLYAVLKGKFQLFPIHKDLQNFIEKFLTGDDVIATQLSVSLNPFRQARSQLFTQFMQPAYRPQNNMDAKLSYLRIGKVLDQLELLYLEEIESLLKNINNKIATELKKLSIDSLREPGILPEWARPGGFDLPSNPFQIFNARITTARVLRFRQNVELFIQDLKDMNAPLTTLRSGILDLHDVNRGERKLIGISYDNSPWANDPKELDEKLKSDLDSIPIDISKYFQIVQWSPETTLNGDSIDGNTVAQNLIKLRTLKASVWLDQAFPVMNETTLGVKSFLQRLREKLFNPDELSPERVEELQQELVLTWQQTSLGVDELIKLKGLVQELSILYSVAVESNWIVVATTLNEKIRFVLQALDLMGVSGNETAKLIQDAQVAAHATFIKQLEPYIKNCKKVSSKESYSLGGFWPERGPFALGAVQFPLTMVCYQNNLYLVRQPGDYLNYMTTMIRNGAPESRIFIGSRPIRLFPVKTQ